MIHFVASVLLCVDFFLFLSYILRFISNFDSYNFFSLHFTRADEMIHYFLIAFHFARIRYMYKLHLITSIACDFQMHLSFEAEIRFFFRGVCLCVRGQISQCFIFVNQKSAFTRIFKAGWMYRYYFRYRIRWGLDYEEWKIQWIQNPNWFASWIFAIFLLLISFSGFYFHLINTRF